MLQNAAFNQGLHSLTFSQHFIDMSTLSKMDFVVREWLLDLILSIRFSVTLIQVADCFHLIL